MNQKTLRHILASGLLLGSIQASADAINNDFDHTTRAEGISWSGGQVQEIEISALRSSGRGAYKVGDQIATVVFDQPVMNIEFFFVHGKGVPAGTATAYNADGRVLDAVRSNPSTHFGDSRNFVKFNTKLPVSAVTFSGGVVDNFRASAYEPDYFLVEGGWVNNDVGENNAEGIFFDYLSTANTLFMAWFTYSSDPKTSGPDFDNDVGAPDNRWLTATFDVQQGATQAVGTLFSSTGGEFNQPRTPFQATEPVGTVVLEFLDCDRAILSYELEVPQISGQFEIIPVEKQVNPAVFDCDPRGALAEAFRPDISQVDADIQLAVRAVQDGNEVALQLSWDTNKNYFGLVRGIRALNDAGAWVTPVANIDRDRPNLLEEDRVAVIFGVEGSVESKHFGCFQSCHSDMNRMPDATEDARHYVLSSDPAVIGSYQSDMWHWRGSRSAPMGYAEDTWVRAHAFGTGAQGRRRDATGPDGRLREDQALNTPYTVTVSGQTRTINLPQYVYNPEVNSGFYFLNDGFRLITPAKIGNLLNALTFENMEAGQIQHALILNGPLANALAVADMSQEELNAVAAQAVVGGMINIPYLQDDLSGESDQHDVRSIREYAHGRVTVTMIRKLDTGQQFDVDLSELAMRNYYMGVGVHDSNDSGRSHHVSVPISLGPTGDVVPVEVASVNDVNWASIPQFTTTIFVPGDMSYQWLKDQVAGHPVRVNSDCASCHSIAGKEHPFFNAEGSNCLGCHVDGRRAATVNEYAPLHLQH